ncbi:MAG: hypothetical protein OEV43_09425 [Coriobacteriia bacterium]|nr:hypothetical protein [Coriobacteriia bacterium]
MRQAAFCSQCGAHVFVSDDGRCVKGHGPESLSGYYNVPDSTKSLTTVSPTQSFAPNDSPHGMPKAPPPEKMLAEAYAPNVADEGPGSLGRKGRMSSLTFGILLALLLTAGLGVYFALTVNSMSDDSQDAHSELDSTDATTGEGAFPEDARSADDIRPDAQRMVKHFYPSFSLTDLALTGFEGEDLYTTHMLAQSDEVPGFYLTFYAQRTTSPADVGAIDETIGFTDPETSAVWLHPRTVDYGLATFAGPNATVPDAMRSQIMSAFAEKHPTLNVTEFSLDSNVKVTFLGIADESLDSWYDDFTDFESVWELDSSGKWAETTFSQM